MIELRCPICGELMLGRSADWPTFPFCGPRCRQIDLGRWLGGRYRIVASEADGEDDPADDSQTGLP